MDIIAGIFAAVSAIGAVFSVLYARKANRISEKNLNEQKKLTLFEPRKKLYLATLEFMDHIIAKNTFTNEQETKFKEVVIESESIIDRSTYEYIKSIYDIAVEMKSHKDASICTPEIIQRDQENRNKIICQKKEK